MEAGHERAASTFRRRGHQLNPRNWVIHRPRHLNHSRATGLEAASQPILERVDRTAFLAG